jgi:alkylhydroperoxidase/carboxymuconolactone decarboxylase family protein YurZ
MSTPEHLQRLLRRLSVGDEAAVDELMRGQVTSELDQRTTALVGIAALVALEADPPSYQAAIDKAHAAGVEGEEILEAVMTVSPLVGEARLGSALPSLALALEAEVPAD